MNDENGLKVEVKDVKFGDGLVDDRPITILPSNLDELSTNYMYSSTAISFHKYAKRHLELDYLTKPEKLYAQQSVDVFLPAILFGVGQVVQNPDLVKMFLEVAFNYVKETFLGDKTPTVRATFLSRETESEKYVSVTYEGPIDGLKDIAPAFLRAIKHEE